MCFLFSFWTRSCALWLWRWRGTQASVLLIKSVICLIYRAHSSPLSLMWPSLPLSLFFCVSLSFWYKEVLSKCLTLGHKPSSSQFCLIKVTFVCLSEVSNDVFSAGLFKQWDSCRSGVSLRTKETFLNHLLVKLWVSLTKTCPGYNPPPKLPEKYIELYFA